MRRAAPAFGIDIFPLRDYTVYPMHIVSKKKLKEFWDSHADAREPLQLWFTQARASKWKTPQDVKDFRADVSIISNNRLVFNIKGNAYRLVVKMSYKKGRAFIRFVGTHAEYDKIDAETI